MKVSITQAIDHKVFSLVQVTCQNTVSIALLAHGASSCCTGCSCSCSCGTSSIDVDHKLSNGVIAGAT